MAEDGSPRTLQMPLQRSAPSAPLKRGSSVGEMRHRSKSVVLTRHKSIFEREKKSASGEQAKTLKGKDPFNVVRAAVFLQKALDPRKKPKKVMVARGNQKCLFVRVDGININASGTVGKVLAETRGKKSIQESITAAAARAVQSHAKRHKSEMSETRRNTLFNRKQSVALTVERFLVTENKPEGAGGGFPPKMFSRGRPSTIDLQARRFSRDPGQKFGFNRDIWSDMSVKGVTVEERKKSLFELIVPPSGAPRKSALHTPKALDPDIAGEPKVERSKPTRASQKKPVTFFETPQIMGSNKTRSNSNLPSEHSSSQTPTSGHHQGDNVATPGAQKPGVNRPQGAVSGSTQGRATSSSQSVQPGKPARTASSHSTKSAPPSRNTVNQSRQEPEASDSTSFNQLVKDGSRSPEIRDRKTSEMKKQTKQRERAASAGVAEKTSEAVTSDARAGGNAQSMQQENADQGRRRSWVAMIVRPPPPRRQSTWEQSRFETPPPNSIASSTPSRNPREPAHSSSTPSSATGHKHREQQQPSSMASNKQGPNRRASPAESGRAPVRSSAPGSPRSSPAQKGPIASSAPGSPRRRTSSPSPGTSSQQSQAQDGAPRSAERKQRQSDQNPASASSSEVETAFASLTSLAPLTEAEMKSLQEWKRLKQNDNTRRSQAKITFQNKNKSSSALPFHTDPQTEVSEHTEAIQLLQYELWKARLEIKLLTNVNKQLKESKDYPSHLSALKDRVQFSLLISTHKIMRIIYPHIFFLPAIALGILTGKFFF